MVGAWSRQGFALCSDCCPPHNLVISHKTRLSGSIHMNSMTARAHTDIFWTSQFMLPQCFSSLISKAPHKRKYSKLQNALLLKLVRKKKYYFRFKLSKEHLFWFGLILSFLESPLQTKDTAGSQDSPLNSAGQGHSSARCFICYKMNHNEMTSNRPMSRWQAVIISLCLGDKFVCEM